MAVEPDDAKFISKLDETSKQKAKEELNERNDKDRELAVQTLRQWILEQDWLKTPTDFQFLLRFLRARKYSQLGARETLENYWTVRTKFPDWCKNVDPGEEVLQEIIKSGIIVCPKRYDNEGRRVLIDRTAHIDVDEANQKWGLKNVFRALVLVSDWYCLDENVQVNGMQVLFDASDITLNTATTIFTGENGKNLIKYYQRSQPVRVKRLNLYKQPSFFDTIFAIIKPLMSEKMRNRVKLHGNSMVSVYKDIDRSVLPTEYLPDDYTGPSAGPLKGIIDEMLEDMMVPEFRSYIRNLSSEKHRVDFFKRKRDDQPAESFRKLHAE
ncbi:alpha-tocopherol transfer protein-like isoform X1 [Mercenaria mercenaria]|uniref:alpha-tocopherol transfer protein-like isoform X1 n=1 Tax=Mercenaria mercenaria TaxID=6596 RepID=UPI001E1DCD54|nr:alpha-tocopherol transfer protein-like isoform X1 [Mercenaria mercenaria]